MAFANLPLPAYNFGYSINQNNNFRSPLLHNHHKNAKKKNRYFALSAKAKHSTETFKFQDIDAPFRIREEILKLCMHNKLAEALRLLHIMDLTGILPGTRIYDALLEVCCVQKSLLDCVKVYNHMLKTFPHWINVYLETKVVRCFVKCGSLDDARQVFDKMRKRDVYTWNIMISGYANYGFYKEALEIFCQMQKAGRRPDDYVIASSLKACAGIGDLQQGKEMHGYVLKSGYGSDGFVGNCLVDMYYKCGNLEGAREVFEQMDQRNAVSWNSMIAGYIQNGNLDEALKLFLQMHLGGVKPNEVSWNTLIAGCAQNGHINKALKFFHHMQSKGIKPSIVSYGTMIDCLSQNGYFDEAMEVFHEMQADGLRANVITWTSLIQGCSRHRHFQRALEMFKKMLYAGGVCPDAHIFPCVLKACAGLSALQQGKEVHGYIIKSGFDTNLCVANAIIDMYAKGGCVEDAHRVFSRISERNVVSWNAMIAGYVQNGYVNEAEELFRQLQLTSLKPDIISWNTMIAGYSQKGHLDDAVKFFQEMQLQGMYPDSCSWSSLILGYAQIGQRNEAQKLFCQMQVEGVKQDPSLWNGLIAGHAQNGHYYEALSLFQQMRLAGVKPISYTLASIIEACGNSGVLKQGKRIHGLIIRLGHEEDVSIADSLIEMYRKCDVIEDAYKVDEKSKRNRNL